MLRENLKRLRKQKGFTQQTLSKLSGVDQTYISDLETGRKDKPTLEIITKLSSALSVKESDLLAEVVLTGNEIPEVLKPYYKAINIVEDAIGKGLTEEDIRVLLDAALKLKGTQN